MAINDLISKIVLEDEFSQAFKDYHKRLDESETKTERFGANLRGMITVAGVAAGAITGAAVAVRELTDVALEAGAAEQNLAISVAAANNEFGDGLGTIESWKQTISDLREETRIYSEKELNTATARLVDMTKRLGLTEDQMQEVLRRTADLSAGKVDLAGGVERVTAALRGEAESAEYLSLSLNETTIRNYAEAHGLVWANLTDSEKAQLRYAVLLDQTNALTGRAAAFAETAAGKQAEYNAKIEDSTALLGDQLIPLREGWIEAMSAVAGKTDEGAGIITKSLAGIAAVAATLVEAWKASAVILKIEWASLVAAAKAVVNLEDPIAAFTAEMDRNKEAGLGAATVLASLGTLIKQGYTDTVAGFQNASRTMDDFTGSTDNAAKSQSELDEAGRKAAEELAKEYEKAMASREQANQRYLQRIAQYEFEHIRTITRLQQELAQTTIEAAQEAAAARQQAGAKLAASLAQIEQNSANQTRQARAKLKEDLKRIDNEIRVVDRELGEELEQRAYDTEQERQGIVKKGQAEIFKIEQDFANKRLGVNNAFENEFAQADPFRRKILEFNRQEQLRLLDEQEQAEKDAAQQQTDNAVSELEARAEREKQIRIREAEEKKEELRQERESLKNHFELEQQARDEAAALAAERQQQQYAEELTRIDEQEAAKVERARQAIEREQQNYDDRLTNLQFAHQQELSQINSQLTTIESAERDSQARRLANQRTFVAEMQRLNAMAASYGASSGGRLGDTLNLSGRGNTNVTVNNYGVPGGYAGARQTGRNVLDAVNGR